MAKRHQVYLGTSEGKNAQLISDLKRKRFLLHCRKVLEENGVALRACLLKYKEFDPAEISSRMAASYENITDGQVSSGDNTGGKAQGGDAAKKQQSAEWRFAPYAKAEMHPESLKHGRSAD